MITKMMQNYPIQKKTDASQLNQQNHPVHGRPMQAYLISKIILYKKNNAGRLDQLWRAQLHPAGRTQWTSGIVILDDDDDHDHVVIDVDNDDMTMFRFILPDMLGSTMLSIR